MSNYKICHALKEKKINRVVQGLRELWGFYFRKDVQGGLLEEVTVSREGRSQSSRVGQQLSRQREEHVQRPEDTKAIGLSRKQKGH